MMSWKPIEDAPKDGRSVLLWARLKSAPAEKDAPGYPTVGRWQATRDLLSSAPLIPTYWTELRQSLTCRCPMVVDPAVEQSGIFRSLNELERGNVG